MLEGRIGRIIIGPQSLGELLEGRTVNYGPVQIELREDMGMMFAYTLLQCSDYRLCQLESWGNNGYVIAEADPAHWHLSKHEGGDWAFKNRELCLAKLVMEVNYHYDRLYDEEGKARV